MAKNRYDNMRLDSSEYRKGYSDGMKASFESFELDAYYAGVGYGKKSTGDKHIGFNSDKERKQFENGMKNKDKHFRAYRAEPLTFLERLFFKNEHRKENAVGKYKRDKIRYTNKRLKKKRSKAKRRRSRK